MENRRHTHIVNKHFQYQYIALTALAAIILLNLFIAAELIFPDLLTLDEFQLPQALTVAALEIALLGVVIYVARQASQHIAGPLYAYERAMNRLGEGDLSVRVRTRKNDAFHGINETINQNLERLQTRIAELNQVADELAAATDEEDRQRLIERMREELSALCAASSISATDNS